MIQDPLVLSGTSAAHTLSDLEFEASPTADSTTTTISRQRTSIAREDGESYSYTMTVVRLL